MDNLLGDVLRRCGVSEEQLKTAEEKMKRGFFNAVTFVDKDTIINKATQLKKEAEELVEDGNDWAKSILETIKGKAKSFAEDVENNWEKWQTLARMKKFAREAGFSDEEVDDIIYDYYIFKKDIPNDFSDEYLKETFTRLHNAYSPQKNLDEVKEKLRNLI